MTFDPFDLVDNEQLAELTKAIKDNLVQIDLTNTAGDTLLNYAIRNRHNDLALLLLQKGADVNHRGEWGHTALHCAAVSNSTSLLPILFMSNAQPDVPDDLGLSPIFMAARNGNNDFANEMIRLGAYYDINTAAALGDYDRLYELASADPDAISKSKFPHDLLPDAVYANCLECVSYLIQDPRIDINQYELSGEPPLVAAVSSTLKNIEIVKALLHAGADTHARSSSGATARERAQMIGNHAALELLAKAN